MNAFFSGWSSAWRSSPCPALAALNCTCLRAANEAPPPLADHTAPFVPMLLLRLRSPPANGGRHFQPWRRGCAGAEPAAQHNDPAAARDERSVQAAAAGRDSGEPEAVAARAAAVGGRGRAIIALRPARR